MDDETMVVGRVLRSSTANFTVGCGHKVSDKERATPQFGGLVKAVAADGILIYGLIYNVTIEDDPFARQLVAAGVEEQEKIEDLRQNRLVPVVVDVLVAGYGRALDVYHRLPPQPPGTLDCIYACNNAELVRFTGRHDWLRIVLSAADVPAEQLLAAALRLAAAARPPDQRDRYLVAAGRELARLLAMDLTRLDGILQQLRSAHESEPFEL